MENNMYLTYIEILEVYDPSNFTGLIGIDQDFELLDKRLYDLQKYGDDEFSIGRVISPFELCIDDNVIVYSEKYKKWMYATIANTDTDSIYVEYSNVIGDEVLAFNDCKILSEKPEEPIIKDRLKRVKCSLKCLKNAAGGWSRQAIDAMLPLVGQRLVIEEHYSADRLCLIDITVDGESLTQLLIKQQFVQAVSDETKFMESFQKRLFCLVNDIDYSDGENEMKAKVKEHDTSQFDENEDLCDSIPSDAEIRRQELEEGRLPTHIRITQQIKAMSVVLPPSIKAEFVCTMSNSVPFKKRVKPIQPTDVKVEKRAPNTSGSSESPKGQGRPSDEKRAAKKKLKEFKLEMERLYEIKADIMDLQNFLVNNLNEIGSNTVYTTLSNFYLQKFMTEMQPNRRTYPFSNISFLVNFCKISVVKDIISGLVVKLIQKQSPVRLPYLDLLARLLCEDEKKKVEIYEYITEIILSLYKSELNPKYCVETVTMWFNTPSVFQHYTKVMPKVYFSKLLDTTNDLLFENYTDRDLWDDVSDLHSYFTANVVPDKKNTKTKKGKQKFRKFNSDFSSEKTAITNSPFESSSSSSSNNSSKFGSVMYCTTCGGTDHSVDLCLIKHNIFINNNDE